MLSGALNLALAQPSLEVVLEDPVFGTPPLALGLSLPMGQRYSKEAFEVAAVPTSITPLGRRQIFSNRPEQVSGEGVLYRGTVDGPSSVYFYHVNAATAGRRFAAAVRNPGTTAVDLTLSAFGTAVREGGYGYRYGGQEVALEVLSARQPEVMTLAAGTWRWLEDELPYVTVGYGGGVSLQAEFNTTGPLEVLVVSLAEETKGIEGLPDVPAHVTGAGRGTFEGAHRRVDVRLDSSEQGFTLAPSSDWIFGVDEMTGEEAQNRGSYGVVYEVHVEVGNESSDDLLLRLYAVNIGCVISGAVRLEDGRVFRLPTDMLGALDVNNYGVAIGQLSLRAGETGRYRFDFTPPGFSCLPVGVVARPYRPGDLRQ